MLSQEQVDTINKLIIDNAVRIKKREIADFSINLSLADVKAKEPVKITNVVLPLAPLNP